MIRIPIYQMIFDGEGIRFSTEIDDDSNQAVIFVIPKFHHGIEIKYSEDIITYFPFDINNEYFELESKIENSIITFNPPKTESKFYFRINFENTFLESVFSNNNVLKYSGNISINNDENSFLIIHPLNLPMMDKMYFQTKGIFVGLTPSFGKPDNNIFDF